MYMCVSVCMSFTMKRKRYACDCSTTAWTNCHQYLLYSISTCFQSQWISALSKNKTKRDGEKCTTVFIVLQGKVITISTGIKNGAQNISMWSPSSIHSMSTLSNKIQRVNCSVGSHSNCGQKKKILPLVSPTILEKWSRSSKLAWTRKVEQVTNTVLNIWHWY